MWSHSTAHTTNSPSVYGLRGAPCVPAKVAPPLSLSLTDILCLFLLYPLSLTYSLPLISTLSCIPRLYKTHIYSTSYLPQGAPDCLDTLVLPLILSMVNNPALVGHTEKPVRKATCKLAKELLKGLTSFYPKGIRPLCCQGGSSDGVGGWLQLGTPNSLENVASNW